MKIGPVVVTTVEEMHFQAEQLAGLLGDENVMPSLVLFTRLLTGETSIEKLLTDKIEALEEISSEPNSNPVSR